MLSLRVKCQVKSNLFILTHAETFGGSLLSVKKTNKQVLPFLSDSEVTAEKGGQCQCLLDTTPFTAAVSKNKMATTCYVDRTMADATRMPSQEAMGRWDEIPAAVRRQGVTMEGASSRSGQLCLTAGWRVRG